MTTQDQKNCDVFVIGGGPAGAATATHLGRLGYKVVMAEKEQHPRFHIGESLLPYSMPMLEELGVLDEIRAIGVHKNGAEFISECGSFCKVFNFAKALLPGPPHAYQVQRAEFDAVLFRNAEAAGVQTLENCKATIADLTTDRVRIETDQPGGASSTWNARFLVDASGRSTVVASHLNQKRRDPNNNSAAIFGHFKHVARKAGEREGNIRLFLTDPGWMWVIPLANGITSVGLVAPNDYLEARDTGIEDFFFGHVERHAPVRQALTGAQISGTMRATGNFSYRSLKAGGPSHIKVGDAYGFIDPIFSTGVHLALSSAKEASDTVDKIFSANSPSMAARIMDRYETGLQARMDHVSWFIYRIHDPAFREMMIKPKNVLGVVDGIVSLLAGDFRSDPRLRFRVLLFKLFHFITRKNLARRTGPPT